MNAPITCFSLYEEDSQPAVARQANFNSSKEASPSRTKYQQAFGGAVSSEKFQKPKSAQFFDVAVIPGQAATEKAIARARSKDQLIDLVRNFAKLKGDVHSVGVAEISDETSKAAISLFNALPSLTSMAKVRPEGEGGLTVLWSNDAERVILVIDDWKLHLVRRAATSHAEYFDDLPFDGEKVPAELIEAISKTLG